MSENLSVRVTLSSTNDLSPALRKVMADIKKLEATAKSFNASFSNIGRAGLQSFDELSRAAKTATDNMRGMANVSRSAARNYTSDWSRANAQRLNDARRTYAALERLESGYLRQIERRAAVERRASSGRSHGGGTGGLPLLVSAPLQPVPPSQGLVLRPPSASAWRPRQQKSVPRCSAT